jgi:hypothetical protein
LSQELAWSSFALLKNTNSCGVVFFQGGKAILARGALGDSVVTSTSDAQTSLDNITKVKLIRGRTLTHDFHSWL